MINKLLGLFLSAFIAGLIYIHFASYALVYLPPLPFGIAGAFVFAVLVGVTDFILEKFVKI